MQSKNLGWNIGDLQIALPIVQGGMGVGVSMAGLASSVASEGGVGTISAVGLSYISDDKSLTPTSALRQEIRKARSLSGNGVLAVNIMHALTDFEALVSASVDEGIDIIFAGAGLPLEMPKLRPSGSRTKLVPIVSSAKAARILAKRWLDRYDCLPDAFVVEGPMAGGHLGFKLEELEDPRFALDNLIAETVAAVKEIEAANGVTIPVIAAGGVFTGEDILRLQSLGAAAVQMGTRFVATEECDANIRFKQRYVDCAEEDIAIMISPVGMPGRAIKNDFLDRVKQGELKPKTCPYNCIKPCKKTNAPYCISKALINAYRGDVEEGFTFVGANGYKIQEITTVKKLIEELIGEMCR